MEVSTDPDWVALLCERGFPSVTLVSLCLLWGAAHSVPSPALPWPFVFESSLGVGVIRITAPG